MKFIAYMFVVAVAFCATVTEAGASVVPTNRWRGAASGGSWKTISNWETSDGNGGWVRTASLLKARVTDGPNKSTKASICVWDFSALNTGAVVTYDYGESTWFYLVGLVFGENKGNITLATAGNKGVSFGNVSGNGKSDPVYITVPGGTRVSWQLECPTAGNTGYGQWTLFQVRGGGTFSFDQVNPFAVYDRTLTVADATVVFNQRAFTAGSHKLELASDKSVVRLGTSVDFTSLICNNTNAVIDVSDYTLAINGVGAGMTCKGKIKGSGTVEIEPSGVAAFTGDLSEFTGKFSVVGSWLDHAGTFGSLGELDYSLDYGGKIFCTNWNFAARSLEAAGVDDEIVVGNGKRITIGSVKQNKRTVYNARISGSGSVVKTGDGYDMEISGYSTYTGSTKIDGGSIRTRNFYPLVSDGLIAFWNFEDFDHPFVDITTNALALVTIPTNTKLKVSVLPTVNADDGARSRRSVNFQTSSGYSTAEASSSKAFAALVGDAPFSHSFWIKPGPSSYYTTARATINLLSMGNAGTAANACAYVALGKSGTSLVFGTGYSGELKVSSCPQLMDGGWHHIVVTYENRRRSIYIDGVLVATDASDMVLPMVMPSLTAICYGYRLSEDVDTVYSGEMDNIAIFNKCLAADEVDYLYRYNRPEQRGSWKLPEPSAHWNFDDASNPYKEVSGNSNITLENDTTSVKANKSQGSTYKPSITHYESEEIDGAYGGCVRLMNGGLLKLKIGASWPESMPSGNDPFSIFCRMRTTASEQTYTAFWFMGVQTASNHVDMISCDYPRKIGIQWSDSGGRNGTVDMSGLSHYIKSEGQEYSWMDTMTVYDPVAKTISYYVDGVLQESRTVSSGFNIDSSNGNFRFMLGGRPDFSTFGTVYNSDFVVDDVQVFNKALTDEQVKLLCRNLRPETEDSVLPVSSPVTVASGAKLLIDENGSVVLQSVNVAGELYIGSLAMLTVTDKSALSGALNGCGELRVEGPLDLTGATGDFNGIITASANVDASALASSILKLVDETVWTISPDDASTYPVCKSSGLLVLPPKGTVYFSSIPKTRQTITIFEGGSISAPDGIEGWSVKPSDDRYTTSFEIEDGKLVLTINPYRGSAIIFK